jgi:hypothetical protein
VFLGVPIVAIVAPDYEIEIEANAVQARFNTGSAAHLYTNNFIPDVTVTIGSFVEATYSGYSPFDLTGLWLTPTRQANGDFYVTTPVMDFSAPSSGSVTIYGYWIDDGTGVLAAEAFASPVTLVSGGPDFMLLVNYEVIAEVLV